MCYDNYMPKNFVSKKVKKNFVIHADTFGKFKASVAMRDYPNYSEILEHLILCYLKDPDMFGNPGISC